MGCPNQSADCFVHPYLLLQNLSHKICCEVLDLHFRHGFLKYLIEPYTTVSVVSIQKKGRMVTVSSASIQEITTVNQPKCHTTTTVSLFEDSFQSPCIRRTSCH